MDSLFYVFFDSGFVGSRPLEEVFIIYKPLNVAVAVVGEWAHGAEHQRLIVLQEDEWLDVLVEFLIGVQREWICVVDLSSNLQLLEPDLDLAVLALDLLLSDGGATYNVALGVADDGILDDAVLVGRQFDHVSGRLHNLLALLLDEVCWANRDPDYRLLTG